MKFSKPLELFNRNILINNNNNHVPYYYFCKTLILPACHTPTVERSKNLVPVHNLNTEKITFIVTDATSIPPWYIFSGTNTQTARRGSKLEVICR